MTAVRGRRRSRSVITSYSIHYTKLYDLGAPRNGIVEIAGPDRAPFDDGTPLELLAPGRRPSIDEFQVSPSTLATFVGEYRDSSDVSLYIRLEDEGFLTVQTRGRARMRLYAESEDSSYNFV